VDHPALHPRIPLVDLKAQYASIRVDIDRAIQTVLDSTAFILGPEVCAFEGAFAAYCEASHCIGLSSGTAALELALRALAIGPGDEVITVAHTFIATAEAISAVGARPVFVDIDPQTYNLDPTLLESAITRRTRAIIPVDLYGQPADLTGIQRIADQHDLAVIEDAAQAHGARLHGRRLGAIADLTCFSFYPGKNLGAYGDAGAVTTNDPLLADRIKLMRNHGRREKYVHEIAAFGERLDTLQAAILSAKLPYLDSWTEARRRIARRYDELLGGLHYILPHVAPGAEPVWHLYVIRTPHRSALLDYLHRNGVDAGIHYPLPLHMQPAYAHLAVPKGSLPRSEEVASTCLSLPIWAEMSDAQQDQVVDLLHKFDSGVH
jgi:dTDP-4-amino-4,6-dideoxygalactose transaminase